MFGIGGTEFLVIIVVAILVLGPEHLPRIMRTVTKVMSDFRRVSTDFQRTINLEANQEEWRQQQAATKKTKKKKKKAAPPPDDEAGEETSRGASAAESAASAPQGDAAAVEKAEPDAFTGPAPAPEDGTDDAKAPKANSAAPSAGDERTGDERTREGA